MFILIANNFEKMNETDYDSSIEESNGQNIVNYNSYVSDDDNCDYSSNDSSSEDGPSDSGMISIPDDHSPEDGADSDDDSGKCCQWI